MYKHIILFDGHNMLFRYFWGMPRRFTSKSGEPVHGAFAFVASVLQHIKRFRPNAAIVCFDSQGKPSRADKIASYKANRISNFETQSPDNPFSQLSFVQSALHYLRIPSVEQPGVEADDLIGSYAKIAKTMGYFVTIASTDSDLFQLIERNITVYVKRGKKEQIFVPETIKETFGILPIQLIDYKALVGDPSDNLPGVPGIGPKTAASLLKEYNTLESIYQNLSNLDQKLARKLQLHQENVFLNKKVIKIDADISIDRTLLKQPNELYSLDISAKQVFVDIGIW